MSIVEDILDCRANALAHGAHPTRVLMSPWKHRLLKEELERSASPLTLLNNIAGLEIVIEDGNPGRILAQ